jgi:hypothetical protein
MLSLVLGYASGFPYENGEVNVAGTFLLTGIASKAGKQFLVKHQFICKAQKSMFDDPPRGVGRIIFGHGAYARALATFQAVVGLGFLNNIF